MFLASQPTSFLWLVPYNTPIPLTPPDPLVTEIFLPRYDPEDREPYIWDTFDFVPIPIGSPALHQRARSAVRRVLVRRHYEAQEFHFASACHTSGPGLGRNEERPPPRA